MADDNKRKVMAAKCPKCGQVVKFYMPEQGSVVKLKCPQQQCGHVFGVKITQKEIHLGNGATQQQSDAQQQSNAQQQSDAQQQQGESHPVTDPVLPPDGTPSGVIARLLQKKKHFYNKDKFHELHLGANTIGMFDPQSPSDIMIEGDRTISHRSVTITVESVGSSYKYLFSVNRSKNPVYLSGKPIAEGTSIYIQPNQEFVLGRTRFCLSK